MSRSSGKVSSALNMFGCNLICAKPNNQGKSGQWDYQTDQIYDDRTHIAVAKGEHYVVYDDPIEFLNLRRECEN